MVDSILVPLSIFVSLASFIPLLKAGHWIVRGFDFPRLHLFTICIVLLIIWSLTGMDGALHWVSVLGLIVASGLDLYRIYPYLPFSPNEVKRVEDLDSNEITKSSSFSVLTCNIRAKNQEYSKMLELIRELHPQIVVLIEVNDNWVREMKPLDRDYPNQVLQPQDNTYGLAIYSKFPLTQSQVRFLVDEGVPSLFTCLQINEQTEIELVALHPRPPRPKEGPSDQRDAELMKISEYIKDVDHSIVLGDLNDVAWSHTTRLFLRNSKMLDPRKGRGLFNTFPAKFARAGFPLDHLFLGQSLAIHKVTTERDIGSDHLPFYAELCLNPEFKHQQKSHQNKEPDDQKEVQSHIDKGNDWDGPEEEVHWND